jgi:hypothetical protein
MLPLGTEGKMLEVVLHEVGDLKRASWLTDIVEEGAVVPDVWEPERTRGLFGSVWDEIVWDCGPHEERYIIHTLRLNNGSRKWRSERAEEKGETKGKEKSR